MANIKKKTCFFVTPIGKNNSKVREKTEDLFAEVIIPTFEKTYNIVVAHKICKTGNINEDVINHVQNDDLVIVNLTGLNGNVLFELGLRCGVKKPFILIAEEGTKLPFDITDERTFFYTPNENGYTILRNSLKKVEKSIPSSSNCGKFKNYEGLWLEIIFDFPERPIALCRLSYNSDICSYELQGHNYHHNNSSKDVDFESNLIISSSEERDEFYYITHPIIMEGTTGFGKINFLKMKQNGLCIAEGYFVDVSNSGQKVDAAKKTKMIKCDRKFFDQIGLKNVKMNQINDSTIIKHLPEYLHNNYNINFEVNS
jgi:hypothetical protein